MWLHEVKNRLFFNLCAKCFGIRIFVDLIKWFSKLYTHTNRVRALFQFKLFCIVESIYNKNRKLNLQSFHLQQDGLSIQNFLLSLKLSAKRIIQTSFRALRKSIFDGLNVADVLHTHAWTNNLANCCWYYLVLFFLWEFYSWSNSYSRVQDNSNSFSSAISYCLVPFCRKRPWIVNLPISYFACQREAPADDIRLR